LHPFDPSIVEAQDLPDATKDFLIHMGMPVEHRSWFPANRVYSDFPKLLDLVQHPDANEEWRQLRVCTSYSIGHKVLSYQCVQAHTGRVIGVGYRGWNDKLETVFTNTNITLFATFVCIFENYAEWLEEHLANDPEPDYIVELADMSDVMAVASATFEQLVRCDPDACTEAQEYLRRGEMWSQDGWPVLGWTTFLINLGKAGRFD